MPYIFGQISNRKTRKKKIPGRYHVQLACYLVSKISLKNTKSLTALPSTALPSGDL